LNPLNQLANGDPDDDTDFWLTIPGLRESLIDAEADYATGRTSGEEEIRTRFGLPPRGRSRPAATWQQNVRPPEASLVSDRPEATSDPWSVLGRWIRDTPWFGWCLMTSYRQLSTPFGTTTRRACRLS